MSNINELQCAFKKAEKQFYLHLGLMREKNQQLSEENMKLKEASQEIQHQCQLISYNK